MQKYAEAQHWPPMYASYKKKYAKICKICKHGSNMQNMEKYVAPSTGLGGT